MMKESDSLCKFCSANAPGRYTCPRCNKRYCSAECYKAEAHADCSELFFRKCFMDGLRDMVSSGQERSKIMQMLRRLEGNSSSYDLLSSDIETKDLAERISDIDLDRNPEEVWHRLTNAEQREFEQMLSDGRAADLLQLWTPWWLVNGQKLIEEVYDHPQPDTMPASLKKIPDIVKIAKAGTSELIPYSIVNVLYAYAYVARLYNGDHYEMAAESAQVLLNMSESCGCGIFPDAAAAVAGCITQLDGGAARGHFISRDYSCAVISDVCKIIAGNGISNPNGFTIAALSDCHRIFGKARRDLDHTDEEKQLRCQYQGVQKKMEFFISWTRDFNSMHQSVLPTLQLESCKLTTELVNFRSKHEQVEHAMSVMKQRNERASRPLITEITSEDKLM